MDGWMGGWVGGWMDVKAVLRIAYSNQKEHLLYLMHLHVHFKAGLNVHLKIEMFKTKSCIF